MYIYHYRYRYRYRYHYHYRYHYRYFWYAIVYDGIFIYTIFTSGIFGIYNNQMGFSVFVAMLYSVFCIPNSTFQKIYHTKEISVIYLTEGI